MNIRDLLLRIRALITPRRVERELHEELALHIEHETEKYVQSGLTLEAARARARMR